MFVFLLFLSFPFLFYCSLLCNEKRSIKGLFLYQNFRIHTWRNCPLRWNFKSLLLVEHLKFQLNALRMEFPKVMWDLLDGWNLVPKVIWDLLDGWNLEFLWEKHNILNAKTQNVTSYPKNLTYENFARNSDKETSLNLQ